jgi:hypothetical protein
MNNRSGPHLASSDLDASAEAFVQHWAQSRIDEPREIMAQHDEAAKQLVAVAAFLQAAYLAVFTFGDLKGHLPVVLLFVMFVPLLSIVACAATVICTVPTDLNVYGTFQLLRESAGSGSYGEGIAAAIKKSCEEIDHIAAKKTRWLHRANWSFIGSSIVTTILLLAAAMR